MHCSWCWAFALLSVSLCVSVSRCVYVYAVEMDQQHTYLDKSTRTTPFLKLKTNSKNKPNIPKTNPIQKILG